MILYFFNHYFPDNSGFGRRCAREIEALSTIDDVIVLCRHKDNQLLKEAFSTSSAGHTVEIQRFKASSDVIHRPKNYKGNGWYELKRNVDVMVNMVISLCKILFKFRRQNVQLYSVSTPLTIPLLGLFAAKLFAAVPYLVSFHDLEPELAMHLKKIPRNHWIVRLELMLEKLVSRNYRKILVTSNAQANVISQRCHVDLKKICSIPNSTDISSQLDQNNVGPSQSEQFTLCYMSAISFDYTIDGLKDFLLALSKKRSSFQELKVLVLGDGEGLPLLKKFIDDNDFHNMVECLGFVSNPADVLKHADAAIIPWKQDIMTETMLPTKLFEYLSLGIPVIAPKFGEFTQVLNNETALLYSNNDEILESINLLMKDRKLKETIGENGRKLYLNHYMPSILNQKLLSFVQNS